jgi:hypothetical protein
MKAMLQKSKILLLALCSLALTACDHIADDERLIEVKNTPQTPDEPETAVRTVLLEDFTGQRCVNCPKGTEVIEQLQEAYGDRLVAVGIHGGPLGFKGTAKAKGLATSVGDEYFSHWNLEYQPVGLIDRHGATNYTDWTAAVRQQMSQPSSIKMALTATLSNGQIAISVEEEPYSDYSGKLQVWVLEDGITALQSMPDGTNNANYVHNHVLRTPVNGTWGQDISLTKGTKAQQSMTQAVDPEWNTEKLSIVAFVYNDSGVEQAVKAPVK